MKKYILLISLSASILLLTACAAAGGQKPEDSPEPTEAATPAPIQVAEYTLDAGKQNPSGDFYPEPTEEFESKVNAVLAEATNPTNTAFENILGLYEHLTRNIIFEENGATDTLGTLLSGAASKTGFTRTYQYLLHQIGAEAHIATANDESNSWVMAMMSDGFYHFDPAEDAKLSNGQSLLYFAMNDEFRWASCKVDSWYLGSDELGGKYSAPKNELQTYLFLRHVKAGFGIDYDNDSLYFADVSQDNRIVRYNYQTMQEDLIYEIHAGALTYHHGNIYYSDLNQRNQLFCFDVATGETKLVDSVFVTRMMVKNKQLIYFDDISSSEKAIPLA